MQLVSSICNGNSRVSNFSVDYIESKHRRVPPLCFSFSFSYTLNTSLSPKMLSTPALTLSALIPSIPEIKSIREKFFLLDKDPIQMPYDVFNTQWLYVDNIWVCRNTRTYSE